jgi:fatty acid desaturase
MLTTEHDRIMFRHPPPLVVTPPGARARTVLVRNDDLPTLALLAFCYAVWAAATAFAESLSPWIAAPVTALALTLHSSLQHEALHGHPFASRRLSDATVFPALGLFIPYQRFRDLHLAHHRDEKLTDPYDDPESNFLDPAAWARLPRVARWLLRANNTLAGRIVLGPAIGLVTFLDGEAHALLRGEAGVARAWTLHVAGLVPVILWLSLVATMPAPVYLAAAYGALSILKIRTFPEHRAHEKSCARSVIVEDRGVLALLFLNNNYHAVHHAHPKLAWHRLPAAFATRREEFLARNRGYRYGSYAEVFRRHLLRAKDPVPHPLMRPR